MKSREKLVLVAVRLPASHVDQVKAITGIPMNATAIKAFVNLNLQKGKGGEK